MKTKIRKLELNRETLRELTDKELTEVAGGGNRKTPTNKNCVYTWGNSCVYTDCWKLC